MPVVSPVQLPEVCEKKVPAGVLTVPLALGGVVRCSLSAAAKAAAETRGHFQAAAISWSKGQVQKCSPHTTKKEKRFSIFVKTLSER